MGDKSEEAKLKPERRARKQVARITLEFMDESTETYKPVNGLFVVYPNQVDIDKKTHFHYHNFEVRWTQSRELPIVDLTVNGSPSSPASEGD